MHEYLSPERQANTGQTCIYNMYDQQMMKGSRIKILLQWGN